MSSSTTFSAHVEGDMSDEQLSRRVSMADQLGPWTQGPFPLGGDLVVGAEGRSALRWAELRKHLPEDLSGKRVLVVGSRAGYDAFMFRQLGAEYVLACEPSDLHRQAVFLESVYKARIDFRQIGWQDLSRDEYGLFDLIHCYGAVNRELHSMLMLGRLRQMLGPQGTALIGGALLEGEENSQLLRFVQEEYEGDPDWWWLPGSRAMRRMLRVAGLDAREQIDVEDDLCSKPGLPGCYLQAVRATRADGLFPVAAQAAPVAGDAERVVARSAFAPGHFYSPVPDVRKLASEPTRSRVWPARPHRNPGIDWRADAQLELCLKTFAQQVPPQFPWEPTGDPHEYFGSNEQLSPLDAGILQAMLRHLKPARVIEVGSGFSSLVTAKVNREHLDGGMHFTCIEPYPRPFLLEGVPGISDLRVEEVQDTPLELFEELGAGDVLFVDTSHTVKTGGEVPWIFSQIVPRLAPGVALHIHDVFLPGEYPEQWVTEEGRNWNENYLVEAFLSFNSDFEVTFGAQWMIQNHGDALQAAFPDLLGGPATPLPSDGRPRFQNYGSSLWMRRRSQKAHLRAAPAPESEAVADGISEATVASTPRTSTPVDIDIGEVAERAQTFARTLEDTKAGLAPAEFWYPHKSLGNFGFLDQLLTGEHRHLARLAAGRPIADIGGADGDCAFFLETLGFEVQLIDYAPTNYNRLRAARMLREALSSSVEIVQADLDAQFTLPETEYGLVFLLGLLYHLKNPFYVLEALAHRTEYCLLSTRVARFSPDGLDVGDIPIAYLVDEFEMNDDPTNFWVFSHACLGRLTARAGWETCSSLNVGNTVQSEMVDLEKDERAFLLLRSKRFGRRRR
jgi:SAM-dependent methyltransferase/predicted O-methyltransferase YrrM